MRSADWSSDRTVWGMAVVALGLALGACSRSPQPAGSDAHPVATPPPGTPAPNAASIPPEPPAPMRLAEHLPPGRWAPEVRERLLAAIAAARPGPDGSPPAAVFDCDNTLIFNDIGEEVAAEQARSLLLPRIEGLLGELPPLLGPPDGGITARRLADLDGDDRLADPDYGPFVTGLLGAYEHLCRARGPHACYTWVARWLAGFTPDEARTLGSAVLARARGLPLDAPAVDAAGLPAPLPIRPHEEMRALVALLKRQGFRVLVVSASNRYVVEAAAALFDIPPGDVHGMDLAVDADGRLSDRLLDPVPYAAGKATLVRRVLPVPPVLVAGDSEGDLEMLTLATGAALVIDRGKPALREAAARNGWLLQPPFLP